MPHPYGVTETISPNTSMTNLAPKTYPAGVIPRSPRSKWEQIEKDNIESLKENLDMDTLEAAQLRLKKAVENTVKSGQVSRNQFTTDLDFAKQIRDGMIGIVDKEFRERMGRLLKRINGFLDDPQSPRTKLTEEQPVEQQLESYLAHQMRMEDDHQQHLDRMASINAGSRSSASGSGMLNCNSIHNMCNRTEPHRHGGGHWEDKHHLLQASLNDYNERHQQGQKQFDSLYKYSKYVLSNSYIEELRNQAQAYKDERNDRLSDFTDTWNKWDGLMRESREYDP
jgi:hypothetical protein